MPQPVVTVTIGEHVVLRFDVEKASAAVCVAPAGEVPAIVAALAKAIEIFATHQPALSPVASGVDAVEKLAGTIDPAVVEDGFAAIDATVVALRDRIDAAVATRITH